MGPLTQEACQPGIGHKTIESLGLLGVRGLFGGYEKS